MNISITRNGFRVVKWDKEAGIYAPVEVHTHLLQLRSVCSIDPGVTLADIFEAVDRDDALKGFLAQYSWCNVDAFHREARKPVQGPPNLPDLEYIEISKCLEFDDDGAQEMLKVGGICKQRGKHIRYGIDLTSVHELAPFPVHLNAVALVRRNGAVIAQAPASFTLLDVLGELYWEIGFNGSPRQRDALVADLLEAARAVRARTAKLIRLRSGDEIGEGQDENQKEP